MFELPNELLVAAVISVFSFIGSLIAIKTELRFMRRDIDKVIKQSDDDCHSIHRIVLRLERLEQRLELIDG